MKTVQSLVSIGLGFALAWTILYFAPQPKVSTFTLNPWPIDVDNSNLALIGVGLATQTRAPPSVMDPSSAKPVMMATTAPKPAQPVMMATTAPKPAQPVMAMAPKPAQPMMAMAPIATPSPSS